MQFQLAFLLFPIHELSYPSQIGIPIALRIICPKTIQSQQVLDRRRTLDRLYWSRDSSQSSTRSTHNGQLRACRSRDRPYLRPAVLGHKRISARRRFAERIKQIAGVPALYTFVDESALMTSDRLAQRKSCASVLVPWRQW